VTFKQVELQIIGSSSLLFHQKGRCIYYRGGFIRTNRSIFQNFTHFHLKRLIRGKCIYIREIWFWKSEKHILLFLF